MSQEISQLIDAARQGNRQAAAELLPLVYGELRKLAAARMANEAPGKTLQATALVHEAYLRVVGAEDAQSWDGRGHFFAAAAEAMRRILVDHARYQNRVKRGGDLDRVELEDVPIEVPEVREDLSSLDEALTKLSAVDAPAAKLIELRYFAGLTMPQAAEVLGVSSRTAERMWTYAKAWLHREISGEISGENASS